MIMGEKYGILYVYKCIMYVLLAFMALTAIMLCFDILK